MNAIETLMSEHRVIEQVLICLEKLADQAEDGRPFDSESAREAISFFRNFADRCHHGKEERHLFPMLEARGLPHGTGPTSVMLGEHDVGRALLAAMASSLDCKAYDNFARAARDYVSLMRAHIQKEDHCLFPMATRLLSGENADRLSQAFDTVEHREIGEGIHENYLLVADRLAGRFGVIPAHVTLTCGHGCSKHEPRPVPQRVDITG